MLLLPRPEFMNACGRGWRARAQLINPQRCAELMDLRRSLLSHLVGKIGRRQPGLPGVDDATAVRAQQGEVAELSFCRAAELWQSWTGGFTDEYLWHLARCRDLGNSRSRPPLALGHPMYVPRRKVASFHAPVSCKTAVTMQSAVISRAG